jgi:hypothetical protein
VFQEAAKQQRAMIPMLKAKRVCLQRDKQAKGEEIRRLADVIGSGTRDVSSVAGRLGELEAVVGTLIGGWQRSAPRLRMSCGRRSIPHTSPKSLPSSTECGR